MKLRPVAKRLHGEGFAVIPTGKNKAPINKDWQKLVGDNRKTPNGNFEGVQGCGIVLGHWFERGYLVCIDVDCRDKDISRHICNYIMELLGGSHPYRVGESPKFAVPVLIPEEYRKIQTALFDDKHRIEVLALGQQFIAYGEHPAGKDGQYQWYNGDFSADTLGVLTMGQLWSILGEFDRVCREAGYEQTERASYVAAEDALDPLEMEIAKRPLDISDERVDSLLDSYPAEGLGYDAWVRVGQMLHHQYEGTKGGYVRWMEWSKKSSKHDARHMKRKWDSFGEMVTRPVTMATLIHLVKETQAEEALAPVPKTGFLEPSPGSRLSRGQHLEWIVENLIPRGTIGQVFAPPGAGKSFMALDMAAHVANGEPWGDLRTVPGSVVFLAGEGVDGVYRRLAAIEQEKGLDTSKVIIGTMPQFASKDHLKRLYKELSQVEDLCMVVIDTVARAMMGLSENDAGDMGLLVDAMGKIAKGLNCTVCAIHHTAKNNVDSSRGSGALTGGVDFELKLKPQGDVVVVETGKMKDVANDLELAFRLITTELPGDRFTDNFGNALSTAVLSWVDPGEVPDGRDLTPSQRGVMRAFQAVWGDESARVTTPDQIIREFGLESPATGLYVDRVREYWRRSQEDGESCDGSRLRMRWKRALDGCIDKRVLKIYDQILVEL